MKISILTPTRGRPELAQRFADSVLSTAEQPDDVELLFYIDDNDPALEQYQELLGDIDNVVLVIDAQKSVSMSWNDLAEESQGDILIMGNDDLIYKTANWDTALIDEIERYDDKIYVAWFNDLINGEHHCAFPIVSRTWYETVGYFAPGVFEFLYNDTWVFDIGKRVDRLHYIEDVITEHMHFTVGKSEYDKTYRQARERGQRERDGTLFEQTGDQREQAADRLKEVINDTA